MKTNISLIINDEQKLRKRTDSILPSILIVIVSAVYNKQWFFVSFPCLSYILTYLPTTYLLEDIYVFNVVTYSVITSSLAFS